VAANTPSDVILTNSGSAPLTIDGFSISNDPISGQPAFTQTNTCGTSVAPQATCKISISAIATMQAYSTGVLTVMDDAAAGPQTLALSYSNGFTGRLLIDFGSRSVGTQGASSTGANPSRGFTLTGPNATDFSFLPDSSVQTTNCTNQRSCYLPIYFKPSALGRRIATVTSDTGPIGGVIGTGLAAGPHLSAYSPVDFRDVYVGSTSSSGGGVFLVNTGTVPLTLNAPVLSGANASEFSVVSNCSTVALNASCNVGVTASPTQAGDRSATLTLTDSTGTAQQTVLLKVTGVNPPPTASPNKLTFPLTLLGAVSAPMTFTVTSYNNDPVSVVIVEPNSPFVLSGVGSCSRTPCQVSVTFAPQSRALSASNIQITDLFSSIPSFVNVSGDIGPPLVTSLSVSPASLTFPLQAVGTTSAPQTVTVTNTGEQVNFISSLLATFPAEYALVDNCLTVRLQSGMTCTITVAFRPLAAGTRTNILQIVSNAPTSPDQVLHRLQTLRPTHFIPPKFCSAIEGCRTDPMLSYRYCRGAGHLEVGIILGANCKSTLIGRPLGKCVMAKVDKQFRDVSRCVSNKSHPDALKQHKAWLSDL